MRHANCSLVTLAALLWISSAVAAQDVDTSIRAFKVAGAVDSLDWHPTDGLLAVQTKPGEGATDQIRAIEIWDPTREQRVKTITQTKEVLLSVRYSPNGQSLVCAVWTEPNPLVALLDRTKRSKGSEIRRWNVQTGEKLPSLVGIEPKGVGVGCRSSFVSLAISPDGKRIAAGSKITDEDLRAGAHIGGEVCVWDAESGKLLWSDHTTHTDIVYGVAFSPDGQTLASAGIDKLIRLWDPDTGRLKQTLFGAGWDGISSLAFSPDGESLASGAHGGAEEGGTVRIWHVATGKLKSVDPGGKRRFQAGTAVRVGFSTDSQTLFAVGQIGDPDSPRWRLKEWDLSTGHVRWLKAAKPGSARAISIDPSGKHVAIGTWEGEVIFAQLK